MIYLIAVALAAFLLFQIQPMVAKIILPYFGGGAAVWTACMLFFQAFLLAGYYYAYLLSKVANLKYQLMFHTGLLFLSLVFLPLMVNTSNINGDDSPLLSILVLLASGIGLPYLLLSSTGPLIQNWFALSDLKKDPYFLYSWSNTASLVALLTFPFLIEPTIASSVQLSIWSNLYLSYVLIILFICWRLRDVVNRDQVAVKEKRQRIAKMEYLFWLGLSFLGVVFLVATTSAMTQNIAPIPFLWILPLCLYLLTFIICFHKDTWYVRWYWCALLGLSAFIAIFLHFIGSQFSLVTQIVLYSCVLFSGCMVCHGELVKSKPKPYFLTSFYLSLSLGGFLGSAFVAFIATELLTSFLEFPLAFCALFFLVALMIFIKQPKQKVLSVSLLSVGVLALLLLLFLQNTYQQNDLMQSRNFYGILSVKDIEINGELERRLIDGTTSHGTQSLLKEKRHIPLSYYRKNTGGALAIELLQHQGELNAAFVGLGAGALAAYGKSGDGFDFFELNPAVIAAAQKYFTFISDSKADVNLILGDARLSLTNKLNSMDRYQLIVLDAFSGDSIPQHLLTLEAMQLYQSLLSEEGVIAVHISNSHLNLLPLMKGLAEHSGMSLRYFHSQADRESEHDSDWVWLTSNNRLLNSARVKLQQTTIEAGRSVVWTDDFNELMSLLK